MKNQIRSILLLILVKKVQIILRLHGKNAAQIVNDAKSYADGILKNAATFPNPNPSIGTINNLVAALEGTFVKVASRVNGAVAERNAKKKTLELALKSLAAYVESVANAKPEQAEVIAKLANMNLKFQGSANKADFAMAQGPNSGDLILKAKAVNRRATYNFELSTDISLATNWKSVQNKTKCTARLSGLTNGTRYFGRVFRTDKNGTVQLGRVTSWVVN